MSKFVIYLDVEPYMKQWLTHAYGDPVVFPPSSSENAVIRRLTTKRPSDNIPEQPSDKAVAISIPSCKYKSPETYNFLTSYGKQALCESLDDLFRINMWQDLGDLSDTSCTKMSAFRAWCQAHGIDIDYAETIRMKWYRMRKAHQEKGINLFSNERNRKKHYLTQKYHLLYTPFLNNPEQLRTVANNTEQIQDYETSQLHHRHPAHPCRKFAV